MMLDMFESKIEFQARLKPASMADTSVLPERSSSLVRSKMRMLASTAMPTESTKAATPARVSVTGMSRKMANDDERVEDQGDAGDHAGQSVVDEHEDEHEPDADRAGEDGLLQEVQAQRRADLAEADLFDLKRQGAVLEDGDQVVDLGRS